MENYKELYLFLFNRMSDIMEEIKVIQQQSEEMFITFPETPEETGTDSF